MKPRLIDSEIDLEPQPERIAGKLHTPWGEEHRVAKRGMLPSQVDLDELGPVRVHAKVNCVELVRPEVWIGQSIRYGSYLERRISIGKGVCWKSSTWGF
jgi:hypothetical protein